MHCSNCGVCCTETEMLLSKKDINRLVNRGFSESFFVCFDEDGYALLKNNSGYCVFYSLQEHRCNVYIDRPSGCRVYPVILDEEKGIVLDDICRSTDSITDSEKKIKGKRVTRLLETIDYEAEARRAKGN